MAEDTDTIIKLFKRFKKEELVEVLKECGVLEQASLETSGSKISFINRVLRCCPEITARHVSLIDLMLLEKTSGISDPGIFEGKLRSQLEVYFRTEVCLQVWNGAYWIRICVFDKPALRRQSVLNNAVFLVYSPFSKYVLNTSVKTAQKDFILQAITSVIGCHGIKEVSLSGRNVQSLTDLLLNSTSQGSFSNFRLCQMDTNPLAISGKRKRKLEMKNILNECEPTYSCCEDESDKENEGRKQFINDAFGTNKQPVLEKVEFKLETTFRGAGGGVQYCGPLHCRVKFQGSSVIEGLKELCCLGLADVPMPTYLANINSLSRNHFLLTDKKRARTDDLATASET